MCNSNDPASKTEKAVPNSGNSAKLENDSNNFPFLQNALHFKFKDLTESERIAREIRVFRNHSYWVEPSPSASRHWNLVWNEYSPVYYPIRHQFQFPIFTIADIQRHWSRILISGGLWAELREVIDKANSNGLLTKSEYENWERLRDNRKVYLQRWEKDSNLVLVTSDREPLEDDKEERNLRRQEVITNMQNIRKDLMDFVIWVIAVDVRWCFPYAQDVIKGLGVPELFFRFGDEDFTIYVDGAKNRAFHSAIISLLKRTSDDGNDAIIVMRTADYAQAVGQPFRLAEFSPNLKDLFKSHLSKFPTCRGSQADIDGLATVRVALVVRIRTT